MHKEYKLNIIIPLLNIWQCFLFLPLCSVFFLNCIVKCLKMFWEALVLWKFSCLIKNRVDEYWVAHIKCFNSILTPSAAVSIELNSLCSLVFGINSTSGAIPTISWRSNILLVFHAGYGPGSRLRWDQIDSNMSVRCYNI